MLVKGPQGRVKSSKEEITMPNPREARMKLDKAQHFVTVIILMAFYGKRISLARPTNYCPALSHGSCLREGLELYKVFHSISAWIYYDLLCSGNIVMLRLRNRNCRLRNVLMILHKGFIICKRFPYYWLFVRGNHRWLGSSPTKGQWCETLIFLLSVAKTNKQTNSQVGGDAGPCDILATTF